MILCPLHRYGMIERRDAKPEPVTNLSNIVMGNLTGIPGWGKPGQTTMPVILHSKCRTGIKLSIIYSRVTRFIRFSRFPDP